MTTITITLPDDVADEVRRRAHASGRNAAEVAGEAVINDVRGSSDLEAEMLEVAYRRFEDGPIGRTSAEVFRDLRALAEADMSAEANRSNV